jgi:outer membrane protein TolC
VDTVQQVPLPVPPTPDDAVKEAETNRQDVRAQRRRVEAADHVVRDSYADYLPLLTANFQPFWQSAASLTSPTTGWQASLVLSVPFYDGGLRYGLKRERSALAAEAKSQLDGLLRQARSDVRIAFEAVRRADEALQSSEEAARLAQDSLQMTQLAYREGATNDLDVVDAERRARDASTQALISEDAARQARIDLLTASGRFP